MFLRKKSFGTRINHRLYCSEITKMFVLKTFPLTPERCITSLVPHEPHIVHVYDGVDIFTVRVTGVPSHFSSGSLMLMFERLDLERNVVKRILFTGHFRLDDYKKHLQDIPSLQCLHENSEPLMIDELYLDTTFCSLSYPSFPTRDNAEEKIWQVCQRWVRRNGMFKDTNPHHVVLLDIPSIVGYERILKKIHHKSLNKWLVHISDETKINSSTADWTSPDPLKAPWLHACKVSTSTLKTTFRSLPCQGGQFEVCIIKPVSEFFTRVKMIELETEGEDPGVSVSHGGSGYNICYSNHPSLREIEAFVRHFSPRQIMPLALPRDCSKEELTDILASFLVTSRDHESNDDDNFEVPNETVTKQLSERKRKSSSSDSGSSSKRMKLDRADSVTRISFEDIVDENDAEENCENEPEVRTNERITR